MASSPPSSDVTITVNAAIACRQTPEASRRRTDPTVSTAFSRRPSSCTPAPTPIQTGVVPGTIEPQRAAVLRGKVQTRDGAALAGVAITVVAHPEFGQTLSRADGAFDLAVNGGGLLTVNYQKAGFLPVQRQVSVPWQDFAFAARRGDDPAGSRRSRDRRSTPRRCRWRAAARSTTPTAARRATLLVPQGTTASLVLPNGTTQPIACAQRPRNRIHGRARTVPTRCRACCHRPAATPMRWS